MVCDIYIVHWICGIHVGGAIIRVSVTNVLYIHIIVAPVDVHIPVFIGSHCYMKFSTYDIVIVLTNTVIMMIIQMYIHWSLSLKSMPV